MARGGRRGRSSKKAKDVWQFGNELRECPTTKNAVPNLPSGKLSKKKADEFVGRLCLLETKTPKDGKFSRA